MSNIYRGHTDEQGLRGCVTVNGAPLDPCNHIVNHSPTGFNWGYGGSGPAQLALAIMVHEFGHNLSDHPRHYQDFKWSFVALAGDRWVITSEDITDWLQHGAPRISATHLTVRN